MKGLAIRNAFNLARSRMQLASPPACTPRRAEDKGDGIVVASYNIHKCVGVDGVFDPARIARVIEEMTPDVIALQEVDTRFGTRKGLLDLEALERRSGLLPIPLLNPSAAHGWHGNIILYRQGTIRDVHEIRLPGLESRGAIVTEIEFLENFNLRIIGAHLGLLRHSRCQQTEKIVRLMQEKHDMPTLLLGDLNEWRRGRRSALAGLHPAFGRLPAPVASFPSRFPFLALDRIVANQDGLIDPVEVHDTPLARLASDHLPLKTIIPAKRMALARVS